MPDEPLLSQDPSSESPPAPEPLKPAHRFPVKIIAVVAALIIIGVIAFCFSKPSGQQNQTAPSANQTNQPTQAQQIEGLQLDIAKSYGDKYADGVLPVGDNQYVTANATKDKVYLCNANFVPANQAGAQTRGPWFIDSTQWNINKKYAIKGSVNWQQQISNELKTGTRVITTNDLPDHATGTFPVASSDPAYQYDRNPNTIKSQSLTYNLAANPAYGTPQCMGGEVGIMLTGVALFNAFDAGGRDAGAWEIQDACEGHPQSSGLYHYHTLSSCIKDVGVGTVIGFALDGFPITGPKVSDGNFLTTDDLDECHGITSEITLDDKKVTMYHYVMTQDFPYSVSCFRSKPIQSPAQHTGGQPGQQRPDPPNGRP